MMALGYSDMRGISMDSPQKLDQIRESICDVGRRLYRRGLVVAHDGNISVRIRDDEVLSTPTCMCKGEMQPDDLCLLNLQGEQLGGHRRPTSESLVHLQIYRQRPEIRAVVHCHPPHVLAYSVTQTPLPRFVLAEVEVMLGEVPMVPYQTPGTSDLADAIAPHLVGTNALIMSHHGTVTFAGDLEMAYWYTEVLEHYCRVLLLARQLGPCVSLPVQFHGALEQLRRGDDACRQRSSTV